MKVIHASEILNRIEKNYELIEYKDVTIKDDLDFSTLNIEVKKQNDKEIIEIKSKFYFINCTFEGNVITCDEKRNIAIIFKKNVHFASSVFLDNVRLSKAIFENDVDFYNSTFMKAVNCYKTIFLHNVTFEKARFQDICDFYCSRFKGITNFNSVDFSGKVTFAKTKFIKDVYFINTKFKYISIFRKTSFLKYTSFEETVFSDNVSFTQTVFKGKNIFNKICGEGSIKFESIIYKIKNIFLFQMIRDFKGKIYFIDSNIKRCSFLYSDMNCFIFQNVKWNIKGNGIKLIDETNLFNIPDDKIADTLYQIEIIYRQLKTIFLNIKDYKSSDLFHYAELRIKSITNKILKDRIKRIKKAKITKNDIEIQIQKYNIDWNIYISIISYRKYFNYCITYNVRFCNKKTISIMIEPFHEHSVGIMLLTPFPDLAGATNKVKVSPRSMINLAGTYRFTVIFPFEPSTGKPNINGNL